MDTIWCILVHSAASPHFLQICLYPCSPLLPAQHGAMLKWSSLLSADSQNPTKQVSLTTQWKDYELKYHFSYGSVA